MDNNSGEVSEQARRRKRINLYKRIIVITIIALILLPTILCIILFCRINNLNKELEAVKLSMLEKNTQIAENTNFNIRENDIEETSSGVYGTNTNKRENTSSDNTEQTDGEVTSQTEAENTKDIEVFAAAEYSEEVRQALADGRKVVYLTFDDGPCDNTNHLLDVLAQYDVKVTFFVNGYEGYEDVYRRIIEEGHTIGMHTYSHQYEVVYGELDSFKSEVNTLSDYLESVTGMKPFLFRFPGGSSTSKTTNINMYIDYLNEENIIYYDWNVASGDAVINPLTAEQIYNNVMNGIASMDVSVVLMHDAVGRETTVDALPAIIESLQAMDALILPITEETVPVHHNVK